MSFSCCLKIDRDPVFRMGGGGGGGEIIPPARIGERECSGKWFWASLWWYHEASLTSRSQTSGGDVDCHQWVEVGGCWACGCSICKHQCFELDASCKLEPVQGDKERCNMGSFWLVEDSRSVAFWIICRGLIVHEGSPARNDKGLDKKLCSMLCYKGADLSDVVQCKPASWMSLMG